MDAKHFILFCGILALIPITAGIALYSYRVRNWFLLAMVFGSVLILHLQITFFGRIWYRGTARGYEISLMDILGIALIVATLLRPKRGQGQRFFWPAGLAPLLIYFFYCLGSSIFSDPNLFGWWEVFKIFKGILIYVAVAWYVRSEKELNFLVMALAFAVCHQCLWSLKLRYIDHMHRVVGTMDHPNSLSMYLCMTAPVLYAATLSNLPAWTRRFCLAGVGLSMIGVILTISRTGNVVWLIVMLGVTVACVSPRITLKKVMIAMIAVACVGGVVAYSWSTLMDRFGQTNLDEENDPNNLGRGSYFRLAKLISSERFWGVGLNNWSWYVTNEYQEKDNPKIVYKPYLNTSDEPDLIPARGNETAQAAPAHNLGALTIGELGWVGLGLFAIIWIRWFDMTQRFLWKRSPDAMHRMGTGILFGISAVFLQSLTEWEFRQLPIFYTFHMLMGAVAALHRIRRQPKPKPLPAKRAGATIPQAQAAGA
jgi:O-Antigen ligase